MDGRAAEIEQATQDMLVILEFCPALDHPPGRKDLMVIYRQYEMAMKEAADAGASQEQIEEAENKIRPVLNRLLALDEETLASAFHVARATKQEMSQREQVPHQGQTERLGSAFFYVEHDSTDERRSTNWFCLENLEDNIAFLAVSALMFCALVLICMAAWEMIL